MGKFIKIPHEDWKIINKEIESYSNAEGLKIGPDDIGVSYDGEIPGMAWSGQVEGKIHIALRPGLSKKELRAYVRHEMGHIKENLEGFGFSYEVRESESLESLARRELRATLNERYVSSQDLFGLMIFLVEEKGFDAGEVVKVVLEEARSLGVSPSKIKDAKELFWGYYK